MTATGAVASTISYVLDGALRLILGEKEMVIKPGEVIEFDTRLPHWFGSADGKPVEYLGIYGPQGERAHHVSRAGGPE